MGSNTDSMADEDLGADPNLDVMMAYDSASEDRSSNESTSNGGEPLSTTHSTASLDSFDIAEILHLLAELLDFANCAFRPNGLPMLKVLAFGDFSYDGWFHVHNKLFYRHT
jgi:hypothetical protein